MQQRLIRLALAIGLAVGVGGCLVPTTTNRPRGDARASGTSARREWLLGALQGRELRDPAERALANRAQLARLAGGDSTGLPGRFGFLGPRPIIGAFGHIDSGRVIAVAADPLDPVHHWLVGSAAGGLWETRDRAQSWTPRTDHILEPLAVGAIAWAPSDAQRVYAGTGDYAIGDLAGAGVLRSNDSGSSWQRIGLATLGVATASALVVDELDADRLWLGACWHGDGVWRSIDGGFTWERRLLGFISDLDADPRDADRLIAARGSIGGGSSNGLLRSFDGATSFAPVAGPWSSLPGGVGRIELAIAPGRPETAWVAVQDALDGVGTDADLLGLWRTDDLWAPTPIWTQHPLPQPFTCLPQCWYDLDLWVDPDDPERLLLAGIALWWRRDSAGTWANDNSVHADQHALATAANEVLVGHDGGLQVRSRFNGFSSSASGRLPLTQFYAGDLHPTRPGFAIAGSQDNGTAEPVPGFAPAWRQVLGSDGGRPAISRVAPESRRAATHLFGISRTLDDGATWGDPFNGIDLTGKPFASVLELCPADDDVALFATDNLWRTDGFFSDSPAEFASFGPEMGNEIRSVTFCAADPSCGTAAFGTVDGRIRLTRDDGATWEAVDPPLPGSRAVVDVDFARGDCDALWAVVAGFSTPSVLRLDGIDTGPRIWSNFSTPLDLPHRALSEGGAGDLYVATDAGVLWASAPGQPWQLLRGLPPVRVFDLARSDQLGHVVAFTWGRGAYLLDETARLFADGFESGDTNLWSAVAP